MRILLLYIFLGVCLSCSQTERKIQKDSKLLRSLSLSYAHGFAVNYYDSHKEIIVFAENKKDTLHRYELNTEKGNLLDTASSIAVLSSVYISYLSELGLIDKLAAIGETDYVYATEIQDLIESKQMPELGSLEKLNHEALLLANTELVLSFGWQGNHTGLSSKYPTTTFVYAYEYLEEHPLGRAEWIKFVAAFFDLEEKAEDIFNAIRKSYESLKLKTEELTDRPKILINMPFKEQWHMPGGQSYSAHFIEDAGGYYPWSADESVNSSAIDWEVVYEKAHDCDVWINTGVYSSYKDVADDLPDMRFFQAFKKKESYNNNARVNSTGANDYWESGLLHVDEVLADLIAIFHPQLLPDRELMYYKALEDE